MRHAGGRPGGLSPGGGRAPRPSFAPGSGPLPAGCPAKPLPGGVYRRRACWRCGAAGRRELDARRRRTPAGTPRRRGSAASLPPGAAAALRGQRGTAAGWLRWRGGGGSPEPLAPPSSRLAEEASHGEGGSAGGGWLPAAISLSGLAGPAAASPVRTGPQTEGARSPPPQLRAAGAGAASRSPALVSVAGSGMRWGLWDPSSA